MKHFIGLLLLLCGDAALAQNNHPARDTLKVDTLRDIIISSTRTNQLLKNTPVTVQVVDREDIDEGTAASPANIRELLTELSGTQMQQTSPTSGNVAVRLQGLDGRYTQLLKDGFPQYGGFSGSLSILQIPPLDLRQVEVIKGAGSALYGGDAIAGIINLVSRTPDTATRLDLVASQTQRGGTDFGSFYGQRYGRVGLTIMGSASRQDPVDVSKDGFTDLPRVRQGTIAPTLFWYRDEKTTLRLGINISRDSRNGGDVTAVRHGADSLHPFEQRNGSDRDYYQLSLVRKGRDHQLFSVKNSVGYFHRSISQTRGDAIPASGLTNTGFSGAEVTSFSEVSYAFRDGGHQVVTGVGLSTDRFRPDGVHGGLGYTHLTTGLFAQDDWTLGKKTILEAGARADYVSALYLLPRLALLYRPLPGLTVRLGGGLAYKLPTVFNASDEEEAYQQVYPIDPGVRAERSASANLSLNYKCRIGEEVELSVDQNFYYTRLTSALVPQADSLRRGWLYYLNAPGPVVSCGLETNARLMIDDLSLYVGYTYTDARREYLPDRPQLPLTPRHRVVSNLSYEVEPSWNAGVDAFYTGSQVLDNASPTRDFWTFDLRVRRNWGHYSLLVNLENLTDTRQTRFGPLYAGPAQSPVFGEVYAPIEGRIVSVAFRYSL